MKSVDVRQPTKQNLEPKMKEKDWNFEKIIFTSF